MDSVILPSAITKAQKVIAILKWGDESAKDNASSLAWGRVPQFHSPVAARGGQRLAVSSRKWKRDTHSFAPWSRCA